MFDGLNAFVDRLAHAGELIRIKHTVDPHLEIAEIADRTMKAHGPALLFEHVKGSQFPLLINAFGSRRRMSLALGVDDLEEHARAIGELVHSKAPSNARELMEMARRLPSMSHAIPHAWSSSRGSAPCQE